jgi:hypothetical protein
MKRFSIIFIALTIVVLVSCRIVHEYPERTEVINRTIDYSLQDSAIIHGYVLDVVTEKPTFGYYKTTILIVETGYVAYDDSSGYFSIKFLPDFENYTIKCIPNFASPKDTLFLKIPNILPNEKIEVKFFHRVVVE